MERTDSDRDARATAQPPATPALLLLFEPVIPVELQNYRGNDEYADA